MKDSLLKCGYKYYPDENYKDCDEFYQKKLDDNKCIMVLYYDKFDSYEFELYEDHENYATKKLMYAIDKSMTLEEIERNLLC